VEYNTNEWISKILLMKMIQAKKLKTLALALLIVVTAIWGSTFIVVKDAVAQMPVMDFLGIRFAVAALAMIALRPRCLNGMTRQGFRSSVILGVVLGLGFIMQTYGLQQTSAAVSGFITGMFVVFTPLVSWLLLRRRANARIWLAVVIATIGLGLISLRGWSIGSGELLVLLCALFFALHIVGLGEWSAKHNVYGMAFIQMAVVAIVSLAAAAPGGITLPPTAGVWGAVLITAILASAFGFFVQTWAQSLISPTRIAVTMTMEPVFAGMFAVMVGGESLTIPVVFGAICVVSAMVITGLGTKPHLRILEP